jgi:Fusaric acid resistance protein-like
MESVAFWQRLRNTVRAYRSQLRFALRMTVSGLLALTVARSLNLPLQGLWVVLTAVVVTQMSVGGSLRATIEYVVGTFGGALYAAVIGILIPHATVLAQNGVLALTIAPLAFVAAMNPNFRVAPFSAVLVLLLAGQLGEGPIESAIIRLAEVALGGAIAVAVSLLVFPDRARRLGAEAAARALQRMAQTLPELLAKVTRQLDANVITRIQDDIGGSVTAFQEIIAEAGREHMVAVAATSDPAPLGRTLLRLRHDFVIIGRAAAVPLPDVFVQRLNPLLSRVGKDASEFLRASANALMLRRPPPPLQAFEASLKAYHSEVASLRTEGLTRTLSSGEAERLFALGFAFEQLHENFADLARCVREYSVRADAKTTS